MKSLAGIGVLVEVGAIEACQGMGIDSEVRGDPVEDHTDSPPMHDVYELHESLGWAEAAGRSEIAGGLVPPGAVEWMLHHGHQLEVGEAGSLDVIGEAFG